MAGMNLIMSNAAQKSYKIKTEKKKSHFNITIIKMFVISLRKNYFDGMADREIVLQ